MARIYNTVLYAKGPLGPRMVDHTCVSDAGNAIYRGMFMLLNEELAGEKALGQPSFTVMEALIVEGGFALDDKHKEEMHITVEVNDYFLSIDERTVQLPNNS